MNPLTPEQCDYLYEVLLGFLLPPETARSIVQAMANKFGMHEVEI